MHTECSQPEKINKNLKIRKIGLHMLVQSTFESFIKKIILITQLN